MRTVFRIARHEVRLALRSGTLAVLTLVVGVLLVTVTVIGVARHETAREQRTRYQQLVASQFRDQPDRHPHRVAHYGFIVFRSPAPLGFFDPGLEDHAGSTIFLEAHRQNGATFSDAAQADGLRRMGDLTMASVLQVFVPLLVFGVGGPMLTRERESGTLSLLLCQGASWHAVVWGKWLATLVISVGVVLPGVVAAFAWLALGTTAAVGADAWLRLVSLAAAHVAYMAACAGIAVAVSVRQRTSRGALITLLGAWALLWVVLPRVAPMAAASLYPLPARAEFEARVERRLRELGDSHDPDDPRFQALRRDTLARYGVTRVEDLPVNYNGLVTMEGERLSTQAYAAHRDALVSIYARQMRLLDVASLLSPVLAMRQTSMTLAGTDLPHVLAFEDQAEQYRYTLVQTLNELHATAIAHARDRYDGSGERDVPSRQRISADHWDDLPVFAPHLPSLREALSMRPAPLVLVGTWTVATLLGVGWMARRPGEVSA
jgi:ABC-2 type transport system permease protein